MCRKKKKHVVNLQQVRKDLDWYVANFKEVCEKCGQPLVVHGFRRKTHAKRQAVYAACWTSEPLCPKRGREICFMQQL
jgi:N-formylglutamate amidohydrolase